MFGNTGCMCWGLGAVLKDCTVCGWECVVLCSLQKWLVTRLKTEQRGTVEPVTPYSSATCAVHAHI